MVNLHSPVAAPRESAVDLIIENAALSRDAAT